MKPIYPARDMADFLLHGVDAVKLARDNKQGDFQSLKAYLKIKFGSQAVQMSQRDVEDIAVELFDRRMGGERYAALQILTDMTALEKLGKPVLLFNAASVADANNINCPYTDMPEGVRAADLVRHVEVGKNQGLLLTITPK